MVVGVVLVALMAVAAAADDDYGDTAAFAVTVKNCEGTMCAGALVSLRAVLTSARCARGAELWVRAAVGLPAVRVLRVAIADTHPEVVAGAEAEWMWAGASADLALLELEQALPSARPILAAAPENCAPRAACYVPRRRHRHLRIVAAALEPATRCLARGAHWPTPLRERALCLLGPQLCQSDWGAGVVCAGKLCGVLSRSAQSRSTQSDAAPQEEPDDLDSRNGTQCGDTHAAASVPRARRFLHCALVRGACGRGECERLCSERWLRYEDSSSASAEGAGARRGGEGDAGGAGATEGVGAHTHSPPPPSQLPARMTGTPSTEPATTEHRHNKKTESTSERAGPGTSPLEEGATAHASTASNAFEFEPNRADFKAGEYGDNAADYGVPEENGGHGGHGGTTAPALPSVAAPTRTAPGASPPRAAAELEARVSPPGAARPAPRRPRRSRAPPRAADHPALYLLSCIFLFGT